MQILAVHLSFTFCSPWTPPELFILHMCVETPDSPALRLQQVYLDVDRQIMHGLLDKLKQGC